MMIIASHLARWAVLGKITAGHISEKRLSHEETDKEPRLDDHVNQGMADDHRCQTTLAQDIGNGESDAKQKGQPLYYKNSEQISKYIQVKEGEKQPAQQHLYHQTIAHAPQRSDHIATEDRFLDHPGNNGCNDRQELEQREIKQVMPYARVERCIPTVHNSY